MAGNTLPAYPVFDTDDDISLLPQKWEEWVGGLEDLISALAVTDHERKWSMLRFYGGDKLRKLETQLQYDKNALVGADPAANPAVPGHQDHYRCLKEALTAHFAPCVNKVYARFHFRSTNQDEGESVDAFISRIRSHGAQCNFHPDELTRQIRDQIVFGCRSGKLRRKALAENPTLERLIQTARAEESAKANAAEIEKSSKIPAGNSAEVFCVGKPGKYSKKSSLLSQTNNSDNLSSNPPTSDRKCYNCGGPFPHSSGRPCPAKGKSCNKCNKWNHFASQCRGGKQVQVITESTSSDDDFTGTLGEVKRLGSLSSRPHLVSIQSSEGAIQFNPDTGADVTIIDDATFSRLKAKPPLAKSNVKLMAYASKVPLNIRGSYRTRLTHQDKTVAEQIFVSNNPNKGISLLSRSASQALGLVTLHFGPQVGQLSRLIADGSAEHPLLAAFPDICKGVGCHRGLAISLPLREGAQHVVAPPSRIPVNLYPKVKAELERLEAEGVFESVPVDDNSQSISRLVPVPKPI